MIFLIFIILVSAATFKEANSFYEKGEYEKAAKIYEELIKNGERRNGIYYNLGNCYWRENKIGLARYYWEKAKKISSDEDIEYNILLVKNMIGEKEEENFIDILSKKISFNTLSIVFLIFEWFFLISLLFYYFTKKERYLWSGVFLGLLFIITGLLFYFYYEKEVLTKEGVVIKECKFFSSPGLIGKEQGVLPEGRKVVIFDKTDNWIEIGIKEKGLKVWIKKDCLKEI